MELPIVGEVSGSDWLLLLFLVFVLGILLKRHLRDGWSNRSHSSPLLLYPYTAPPARKQLDGSMEAAPAQDPVATAPGENPIAADDPGGLASAVPSPPLPLSQHHVSRRPDVAPAAARPLSAVALLQPDAHRRSPSTGKPNGHPSPNGRRNGSQFSPASSNGLAPVGDRTLAHEELEAVTLQLLPGRLDVVTGADKGLEIRFVKQNTTRPTEYTLGRAPNVDFKHVQIQGVTVSRVHAGMRFSRGEWTLVNLSTTNPTRVAERDLVAPGEEQVLADGDRIELGEVVLRFSATTPPVRRG